MLMLPPPVEIDRRGVLFTRRARRFSCTAGARRLWVRLQDRRQERSRKGTAFL